MAKPQTNAEVTTVECLSADDGALFSMPIRPLTSSCQTAFGTAPRQPQGGGPWGAFKPNPVGLP
ncbi:hypothetical protein SNOG_08859 [Parastagonospora nodorum SN15]|uniref:Uncharacterized protein n=1 Tax=Phaeosphaeria nodorum (strain SN15 / ATCC MYA-4574 / FGSC 10173) TaxID=321614 RepID=Q0UHA5_PHANO|nr:hypothetical protein SNOG_08859 [Parastagonospora nodorum SN15]EAT84027.1 hypothetical protein SNOG_08859 [Parastagonospora nodorum SN15]